MAFWKKSDDPWDINPEKKKKQTTTTWWENDTPAEPAPTGADSDNPEDEAPKAPRLGDSIKSFFGGKKEEEAPVPAEKCPWCGKDMERGYIDGGRDSSVMWRNWKVGFLRILQPDDGLEMDILDEGEGLWSYKTVWLCRDCNKMTLDAPAHRYGPNYTWENGQVKLPDDTEKEDT